jgi:PAS domain S-box-containing protein
MAPNESRFKVLFDHSSDAHLIIGENGLADCNDATIRLLKCKSKSEVLSLHPAVLSPEYQPDGQRSLEKSKIMDGLARKNGFHRFEWVHKKADGEEFPVQVTLNAIDLEGKPALIAVWHDLTEIKRTEARLRELNDRMQKELERASEFQRSLLPAPSLPSEWFESAWFYKPCDELGGDSLNIFPIENEKIGFYVLDVTGHGATSALLSVTATHFLSGFLKSIPPGEAAVLLNQYFSAGNSTSRTLTLVNGVLDLKSRVFRYTAAGHIGPVVLRKDGRVEQRQTQGIPIGMMADAQYPEESIALDPGDSIFLISDGVYEVRNAQDLQFGLEGVYAHLKREKAQGYSLEYTVNSLARAAYHWRIPKKPDDDISIVGFRLKE